MKLLKEYFELQKKIYDYFGYVEDWVKIPLSDETEMYWSLTQYENGTGGYVIYHENKENITEGNILYDGEKYYSADIYTQRFLPKWVYRTEDYTMVCANPHEDGNKFLMVFDNQKEVK